VIAVAYSDDSSGGVFGVDVSGWVEQHRICLRRLITWPEAVATSFIGSEDTASFSGIAAAHKIGGAGVSRLSLTRGRPSLSDVPVRFAHHVREGTHRYGRQGIPHLPHQRGRSASAGCRLLPTPNYEQLPDRLTPSLSDS